MFSQAGDGYGASSRHSRAGSLSPSEIDDRPSSFYASPTDNDRSMRERRHTHSTSISGAWSGGEGGNRTSPSYGQSIFGTSWFQNPAQTNEVKSRANTRFPAPLTPGANNADPFEHIVTRSYLNSTPTSPGFAMNRRSGAFGNPKRLSPVAVNKQQISGPTLQTNSLEFTEHRDE